MICLGIESSAYVFGVGIINEKGEILANEKFFFKPEPGKGMIPREAAEAHAKNSVNVLKNALKKTSLNLKDIDIIAFTQGMGIPNNLRVGAALARFLAQKFNKPLIGVNHAIAHIEIGKLTTGAKDPIIVFLSGGNTQIIAFAEGRYRIFGETQDIAIGNAIDMFARELGFEMPGGPKIDELAKKGKYIELPYVVKGMDVSFSGILTEAIRKLKKGYKPEDIAYSFEETCFAMLVEVAERALAHTGKNEVLLVGGVAACERLREMFRIMCKERNAKMYVVKKEFSGDNGVMIAWTGLLAYKSGKLTKLKESGIRRNWRIDEVEISWI